jgi:chemotaxis protein MotA
MSISLEGVPTVLAIGLAAVGACGTALAAAHMLKLHRHIAPQRPVRSPEEAVVRIAEIAEVARRQGLLTAESLVDAGREPILAMGISLAIEGAAPDVVRERLDAQVQARVALPVRGISPFWGPSVSPVLALAAAGMVLAVILAYARNPASLGTLSALAMLSVAGAMVVGVVVLGARDQSHASKNDTALAALLEAAGAGMIRQGFDGGAVQAHLTGLLPPSSRPRVVPAKAA